MLSLNATVTSHSWLRVLILIGEIITGLNRFNFQPIPVAAPSGKGLVAGLSPTECVCVCVCVSVFVCVSLSSATITSTPTVSR